MNNKQDERLIYAEEWNVSSQYFYEKQYYDWMIENIVGQHCVLEIGCGTGYSTLALLEKGFNVVAVEKNIECLNKAKRLVTEKGLGDNVIWLEGDIVSEEFRKNLIDQYDFDIVICWNIGTYWNEDMLKYYVPHMLEYGLDTYQIHLNPESSYAELIIWYACKVAKEKNIPVNIVDRSGTVLDENSDPYYKCLKDEFAFRKIKYKNKEGKTLSKGGRVLTVNGQVDFSKKVDIFFISILMDN